MRWIGFGPMVLGIEGPLADIAWPIGATACEVAPSPSALVVTTELVDTLPPLGEVTVEAKVWRSEKNATGTRFAVVGGPSGMVVADLQRGPGLHLRVPERYAVAERAPWFDVLLQTLVADLAPEHGGLLLHAACVETAGRAVLLCGRSGVGKTTLATRLVRAGGRPMSHDRTVVFGNGAWRAVSTPWGHDGMLAGALRELALGSVLFLEQASLNSSTRLTKAGALSRLAAVILGARSERSMTERAMTVAAQLCADVPCYVTKLTNDERATDHVLEVMQ